MTKEKEGDVLILISWMKEQIQDINTTVKATQSDVVNVKTKMVEQEVMVKNLISMTEKLNEKQLEFDKRQLELNEKWETKFETLDSRTRFIQVIRNNPKVSALAFAIVMAVCINQDIYAFIKTIIARL